ncbi:MAG: class II aldolase/adducin family protein [Trueperaceae bacterium]|nr:MAG: class II aldolase/adducin family protein [Trueperaceae bacterium]
MKFTVVKTSPEPLLASCVAAIVEECLRQGHALVARDEHHKFVLNITDLVHPAVHRRRSRDEMVVSIGIVDPATDDIRSVCYSALIQTVSNMLFGIQPSANGSPPKVYTVTPEVGFFETSFDPAKIYQVMLPVVSAHFVLGNRISVGLPPVEELDAFEVDDLIRYGSVLDRLGLLPAPFPLGDVLSEELQQHLFRIFEIKGLSYGNLSARATVPGFDDPVFWMTARGVDKAHLRRVGKDILLVTGYDEASGTMNVSVPPEYDRRARVSVDAVEHYLIYSTFPDVGAIVHVHAWIDGVSCTRQNYPCGTRELADEVVRLLKCANTPEKALVGLKNHGLTVTGADLGDIFGRIEGKLLTTVPMYS